ncbi:hypothetical protein F4677DRAFT_179417 [Hypoxylon crocopeplum]|nr:hypothetical protein F4677DRAFT_179417 [Hypoxylon crocopeplum]
MASCQITGGSGNDSNPGVIGWRVGGGQRYPPPEALPDYVNRALPRRPNSNVSSIYDSLDEDIQLQPTHQHQLTESQYQDGDLNISPAGVLDEAGFAIVQPPTAPLPQLQQPDIAAPQPIYPANKFLDTGAHEDFVVSPVSGPLSGSNSHQQYEVSPISPGGSQRSLHSTVSESVRTSRMSSSTVGDIDLNKTLRRHGLYMKFHTARSSGDLPSSQPQSPHHHQMLQQINLRYSDPGSPISGAVIHPPTSFPSDPDLRSPRHSRDPHEQQAVPNAGREPLSREEGGRAASGVSPLKVSFAGARSSGFSTRPRANSSRRTAPAPPPLKLSERLLVEKYVKTPFPVLEEVESPRPSEQREEGSVLGEEDEAATVPDTATTSAATAAAAASSVAKKRNRVSSIPGFGLLKRAASFHSGGGRGQEAEAAGKQAEVVRRHTEKASTVPRVRSILSRAKLGLGIGTGSEEARKERRREEMKRQIRVGERRP